MTLHHRLWSAAQECHKQSPWCCSHCIPPTFATALIPAHFHDDTAIVGCIKGGQEGEYRRLVDTFVRWCRTNQLQLNATKIKEMGFDFRRTTSPLNKKGFYTVWPKKSASKRSHTLLCCMTVLFFDYDTNLLLYCLYKLIQCLDLFPSSVPLTFHQDPVLMMVESGYCVSSISKDSQ